MLGQVLLRATNYKKLWKAIIIHVYNGRLMTKEERGNIMRNDDFTCIIYMTLQFISYKKITLLFICVSFI